MAKTLIRVPVGDLALTATESAAVYSVAQSNRLSPGTHVKEFESAFARRHECDYGVMVNSGTDALRIALATLKEVHAWKDGDIVLVPSVTFVATINVVLQLNLVPMLIDVSMYDFNMNPENLLRRWPSDPSLAARIKGIIVAHLCGKPADMSRILEIAWAHDLKIIEDSCETMGVCHMDKPVGSWGHIGCFSFYVCHLIATGVGGMAITSEERYERVMRSFMNHGRDPDFIPNNGTHPLTKEILRKRFLFERIGYSSRPTEFEAALGLQQLRRLSVMIAQRQRIAEKLFNGLSKLDKLMLPNPDREHAFMMFPIVLRENSRIDKFDLCLHLERRGIETRELLPLTNQPCYKGRWREDSFPVAKWVNEKGFYIGCHPRIDDESLEHILQAFNSFDWKA